MSNGDNPYWDEDLNAWILHSEGKNCQRTEIDFMSEIESDLAAFISWMETNGYPRYVVGGTECNLPEGGGGCHGEGSHHCCGGAVDFGQLNTSQRNAIDAHADSLGFATELYSTSIHVTFNSCAQQ